MPAIFHELLHTLWYFRDIFNHLLSTLYSPWSIGGVPHRGIVTRHSLVYCPFQLQFHALVKFTRAPLQFRIHCNYRTILQRVHVQMLHIPIPFVSSLYTEALQK